MTETIRDAVKTDIPRIVELGTRFWSEGYKGQEEIDQDIAFKFAENMLANPNGKIIVAEKDGEVVGLIGFIVFRHFWTNVLTGQELFWYCLPEHRPGGIAMRLMWEAERVARELGVVDMVFTAPSEAVGQIYKRFGYKFLEIGCQKRLNPCQQ